jgi:hypothetical protein
VVAYGRYFNMNTKREATIFSDGLDTQGKAGLPGHGIVLTRLPKRQHRARAAGSPRVRRTVRRSTAIHRFDLPLTGNKENSFDPIETNAKKSYSIHRLDLGQRASLLPAATALLVSSTTTSSFFLVASSCATTDHFASQSLVFLPIRPLGCLWSKDTPKRTVRVLLAIST